MAARCGRSAATADGEQDGHGQRDAGTKRHSRWARGGHGARLVRDPTVTADAVPTRLPGSPDHEPRPHRPPSPPGRGSLNHPLPACQRQAEVPGTAGVTSTGAVMIRPAASYSADSCAVADFRPPAADLASDESHTAVRACHLGGKGCGLVRPTGQRAGVMRAGARPPAVPSDGLTAVLPQRSVGMHELVIAYG
jgi:hypothetical protein